jgi:hypothetical protein
VQKEVKRSFLIFCRVRTAAASEGEEETQKSFALSARSLTFDFWFVVETSIKDSLFKSITPICQYGFKC